MSRVDPCAAGTAAASRPALALLAAGALLTALAGCRNAGGAPGAASVGTPAVQPPGEVWYTVHTTRLPGRDPIEAAVYVSELIYAAAREEDRPDAVLLARVDRPAHAILAVNRLIHFPTNAPLLYVEENRVPPVTRAELLRLRPEGMFADGNVQVYAVGDIGDGVLRDLGRMGFKVRHFAETDPFKLAEDMDNWSGAVHGDHPDEVVLVPIDSLAWALPFSAWNAHEGQGFFWVTRDSVPAPVVRALKRRFGKPYSYLVGRTEMASPRVEEQLAEIGFVERIDPPDVYALSAFFAGFKDDGRNFGFIIGQIPRAIGWGIQEDGHNYTFANPAALMSALPASILSHLGKHGPMLLVRGDEIPAPVANYLGRVRPRAAALPAVQQLNHGWVIGDSRQVSARLQAEIDDSLAAEPGLPTASSNSARARRP